MAAIKCNSCHKEHPFLERMLYCAICGTLHPEIETKNASQRLKQDVIIAKFKLVYSIGGFLTILFVLNPVIAVLLKNGLLNNGAAGFVQLAGIIMWFFLIIKAPLADKVAKKKFPEQSSAA